MWIAFYHNFGKPFKIDMSEHNNNVNKNTCMHAAKIPPPQGVRKFVYKFTFTPFKAVFTDL
jgi:hypothetical protein